MKVPRVSGGFHVSIGDYLENVRSKLIYCLRLSIGDPGDPDNLVLRVDHLHSETHAAAARAHEKIRLLSEDKVFYFPDRHIGLRFGVTSEIFELLPQDTARCVDFLNRHFDAGHGGFRVHVAAAGEVIDGPEPDRVLRNGVPGDAQPSRNQNG